MIKLILLIILMAAGAYFRLKFDKNYIIPVINQNEDLSFLNKWGLILVSIAIFCFIFNFAKIGFVILILLFPFLLYLNFKTYWIAFINFLKK